MPLVCVPFASGCPGGPVGSGTSGACWRYRPEASVLGTEPRSGRGCPGSGFRCILGVSETGWDSHAVYFQVYSPCWSQVAAVRKARFYRVWMVGRAV